MTDTLRLNSGDSPGRIIEEARKIADRLYGLPGDTLYKVTPARAEAVAVTIRILCDELESALAREDSAHD